MKWLMYCIFRKSEHSLPSIPPGVQGGPISIVEDAALAAAISEADLSSDSGRTEELMAFHQVIAALHDDRSVVPVRFGAVFNERTEIRQLLESRREGYTMLLNELDGCVEMGIRLIVDEHAPEAEGVAPVPGSTRQQSEKEPAAGRAYLMLRKARYSDGALLSTQTLQVSRRYQTAFEGLYKKFRAEKSKPTVGDPEIGQSIVSLYFLIPRTSVAAFRKTFRELSSREAGRVLLSGPWPPYNFVLPEDSRYPTVDTRETSHRGGL